MIEFVRFFVIGVLNTAIDFIVLNILTGLFGSGAHGSLFILFKSISFIAAVINSYFFNKYWVFEQKNKPHTKEALSFFAISGIGFGINVSISYLTFITVSHMLPLHPHIAINAGALLGTVVVLLWNFFGYKHIVFKK